MALATGGRASAILAALQAEWERRRAELDADPSVRRLEFIVHVERRGPTRYAVEFRKSCCPAEPS